MRHGKKIKSLKRNAAERKALLTNLAKSLIRHKRIKTTLTKAKVLRSFIEPIITKAKVDSMHNRRQVFAHFQDKNPVKTLFNEIAFKVADRPGGYTRIIRLNPRLGDAAEMALIELVDYNELLLAHQKQKTLKNQKSAPSNSRAS